MFSSRPDIIVPIDGSKGCSKCRITKPLSEFSRSSSMNCGYQSWCKACVLVGIRRARMKVLRHYGGDPVKCQCCGEFRIEFMSLDHIGGLKGKIRIKSDTLFRRIIREKFPEGFRVLCHNCNLAHGFYGYCPHEREVEIKLTEENIINV